jgi:uncharacterized protein (TIGR03435 family)
MAPLVLSLAAVILNVPRCLAQGSTDWQVKAGGAMTFEVASIKFEVASIKKATGPFQRPSFPLSSDDAFREPNGHFHADFALPNYIQFAYKIWFTDEEVRAMLAKLPRWAETDRFDIEARAPLHATKDQYRLMMQALLAERFGLRLHFEQRELPVLAMVLARPGRPGPKLIPHEQGQSCDEKPKPETFPEQCYGVLAMPGKDGMVLYGSRATAMPAIAEFVAVAVGRTGDIGRRVVDQTGLSGLWDFTLQAAAPDRTILKDDVSAGETLFEAIGDQLGLKLKPVRAVVSVLVVDHVERPSDN